MECINNMNNSLENWCIANNKKYLIEEWDYESNDILPSQVTYGSHKEVFWICQNGHKYKKQIHSRCQGTGCSICSGVNFQRRNLLFDDYPEFLDELDLTVNTYDDLKNITCSSQNKISLICKKNHKYIQSVVNKVKGKGCPICNNKQVLQGFNDLVTWCKYNNCTEILDDWDYELNDFLPEEVTYGSNKMCNFICHICGYKWKTRINSRTSQKTGCFKCSKRMSSSFPEQAIYYYLKKHFPDAINGDRECLAGKELDIYIPSCKFAIEYDGQTWHKDIKKDENKDLLCKEKDINLYRIREDNCKLIRIVEFTKLSHDSCPDITSDYVFPNSSSSLLSSSDISSKNNWEIIIAINEIYARYGYSFSSTELNNYFENKSWYNNTHSNDITLNDIEDNNLKLLAEERERRTKNALMHDLGK